jgi:hypothetical protein
MRVLLIALLIAACGDNAIPPPDVFTGLSGSRIKLQWYLYQDGARQLETAAFYDAQLHVRCEPMTWADDVTRCTPIADTTVFRDAECMMELGHATSADRTPKYFVGQDRIDGTLRAARLLRVGARVESPPTAFYERRDGTCTPVGEPFTITYYETAGEVDIGTLPEVWAEQIEGERLGLRVLASVEGFRAPVGYHDDLLDFDCRPEARPDGSSACVPANAIAPVHFADPYCEQRIVVGTAPPQTIRIDDANGCPLYHGAGDEHASLVYRREGTTCVRALLKPDEHAYRIGEPLPLAPVERIVENDPEHRLQRIAIAAGPLLTLDDRLYDTATRTDCRSIGNGELAVCVPTNAATAAHVYSNDKCSRELLVADLPPRQCSPSAFAVADLMSIHAIGAPYAGALYVFDPGGQCRPRAAIPDTAPHLLGPAIPPTTFVAGVVFSER